EHDMSKVILLFIKDGQKNS
ncbi:hypothetical protein CP09DC78_0958B, partial [Chlamydia psittaci 09DC78]